MQVFPPLFNTGSYSAWEKTSSTKREKHSPHHGREDVRRALRGCKRHKNFLFILFSVDATVDDGHSIEDGEIRFNKDRLNGVIRDAIFEVFRKETRKTYKRYVSEYKDKTEIDYDRIHIQNQKTKWASYSSMNNLSFNLRLMMAPEEIIEYVVVHDMAHLDYPNRSTEFWDKVKSLLPDCRERR